MNFLFKLLLSLITVIAILCITFVCLHIAPGGPFDSERKLPPEIKANLEAKYGLKPQGDLSFTSWMIEEFKNYGRILANGNLGPSLKHKNTDVWVLIKKASVPSLTLGALALSLALGLGIPLGLFLTYKSPSATYKIIDNLAGLLVTLPHFTWAALFVWVFCFQLGWLPAALWESPTFAILPAVVLALHPLGLVTQMTHTSSLAHKSADFTRVAATKGLSIWRIYLKHILKNSLIPVFAIVGPLAAHLLTGSFIIENIFAIPGLGRYFIMGVLDRDYFLVMGILLIYSVLLVSLNILSELAANQINPRRNS
jgi:oligopeptide transport system permease protein